MKPNYIFGLVIILFISCGKSPSDSIESVISNGNLASIRAKRGEIIKQQQDIAAQLQELDQAISDLDTIKKLPLVTTITATKSLFTHYLELQGSVETKQNIVLYPEMGGILSRVYVTEGQSVYRGQLLARIDDGGLGQQLSQAEVQAELAKTTFERQKRLWEQKIGSEIQYLQSKTAFEAQNKVVEQIKRQLAKTTINAPFSGIIDQVITEQGSVVAPSQTAVIRIVNLKNMYIETEVPERYIPDISKGKAVEVFFPVLNKTVQTKIRQVGNYINPNNRSFKVEFDVPAKNGEIKPNLTAKVKINDYTNTNAILIPQSIISENAEGEQYTYVASSKNTENIALANRVIIETGKTKGGLIEVLKGLKQGDAIISEGARSVRDGQKVEIIN